MKELLVIKHSMLHNSIVFQLSYIFHIYSHSIPKPFERVSTKMHHCLKKENFVIWVLPTGAWSPIFFHHGRSKILNFINLGGWWRLGPLPSVSLFFLGHCYIMSKKRKMQLSHKMSEIETLVFNKCAFPSNVNQLFVKY